MYGKYSRRKCRVHPSARARTPKRCPCVPSRILPRRKDIPPAGLEAQGMVRDGPPRTAECARCGSCGSLQRAAPQNSLSGGTGSPIRHFMRYNIMLSCIISPHGLPQQSGRAPALGSGVAPGGVGGDLGASAGGQVAAAYGVVSAAGWALHGGGPVRSRGAAALHGRCRGPALRRVRGCRVSRLAGVL